MPATPQDYFRFWPARQPHEISVPRTSLWFNVEVSAARFPNKTAIYFYESTVSYSELQRDAEALAGYLQFHCNVRRGDRVALYMQNSPQFVIAYYAILRADAMVVPINPMNRTLELERIVEHSGAKVIVTAQELLPQVEPLIGRGIERTVVGCYSDHLKVPTTLDVPDFVRAPRASVSGKGVVQWQDAIGGGHAPAPHLATADDLCVMPYTSGTTGKPKGCVHRHKQVLHTLISTALWDGRHQEDCLLSVLPLFHVTGMQNGMNVPLAVGASVVIMSRWNRDTAAALIARHRVTRWAAVPTMIVDLLTSPSLLSYDLSSLKCVGGGGAAMPEAVARTLNERCGLFFLEGYGMSETMAPTHANPPDRGKAQCLGIPIYNTESRLVDPVTLKDLPVGEVGEIIVNGPQVMDGYWNDPAATEESFVTLNGKRYLRTGDLGRVDEEGYYFFVDRIKRMINASGYKVWPADVESLLYAHPAVQEAVVISTKDERRGETVKALIVLKPNARGTQSAEQIVDWAKANMAAYKVPRVVELVESLPKSAAGKIMWRVLQEQEDQKAGTAEIAASPGVAAR